jgi:DNA polymerase-1
MQPKSIFDVRGTLMHMYNRGISPDAIPTEDGKSMINPAGWGLANWIEEYLIPTLEFFPAVDIIAVWDGGSKYRTDLHSGYKATRRKAKAKQDPRIEAEIEVLEGMAKRLLAYLGAVNIIVDRVEADDVIALLCQQMKGVNKNIRTVDADLLQLTDDTTTVFLRDKPIEGEYKGVPFNLIRLNKSMVGDSSDDYIGIKGFGEGAWNDLVEEYGHDGMVELEEFVRLREYDGLKELVDTGDHPKLAKLLTKREEWELGYDLASLHPEICYGFAGKTQIQPKYWTQCPNREKALKVLTIAGCPHFIEDEAIEELFPSFTLVTADNVDEVFDSLNEYLPETPVVAFDYESYDTLEHKDFNNLISAKESSKGSYVDVLSQSITGASFNFGKNLQHTIYLSVDHAATNNLDKQDIADVLLEIQDNLKIPLVAHSASFEEQLTKQCLGVALESPYDTVIMSSYVDENVSAALKSLSKDLLGYAQKTYLETLEEAGVGNMRQMTGEQVLQYGCDDSFVTAHLFKLFEFICVVEGSWEFVKKHDTATVHPLNRAFEAGIRIDYDRMQEIAVEDTALIKSNMESIRATLTEHCKEINFKAADALAEADLDNLKAIMKHEGKAKSAITAKMEEKKLHWQNATVYVPYEENVKKVEFIGTPAQLNKVLTQIIDFKDMTDEQREVILIASVARTRINTWLTTAKEWYRENAYLLLDKEAFEKFLTLFGESANTLRGRYGAGFDALSHFCAPYLSVDNKVVSTGDELSLASPKQMQEILYCKLALPVRKRTKKSRGSVRDVLGIPGSPGGDEEAISMAIAEDCTEGDWRRGVLELLVDTKAAMTRHSLYYAKYPKWAHPIDGMIHPRIRNCGTVTRRPTGASPNILQVSKGKVRTTFIPRYKHHVIVALDFSGQELRITGSEANDPVLIDAYTGGGFRTDEDGMVHPVVKDIHSVTACSFAKNIAIRNLGEPGAREHLDGLKGVMDYDFFRAAMEDVTHPLHLVILLCRKMAKTVNFLIIYGGEASTLAMKLGIPVVFAELIMEMVFVAYGRLAPWQKETIAFGRLKGYVETAYGTRKHLTADIRSKDGWLRSRMERQAVNQTIQGCAADILKIVLTAAHHTRLFEDTKSVLIAPVYDEIVASVPADGVFEYAQRLQSIMNVTPPGHAIPMMAEVSMGPSWGSLVELGDNPSERKMIQCIDDFRSAS